MTPQPMPVPDLDDQHVLHRSADAHLAQRHHVHVVVDEHRAVVAAERAGDRVVVPARHDRRVRRAPGRELHGPGHADAHRPHVGRRQPGLGEHLLGQPVDLGEHRAGALGDVDRVPHRGEDLRGQVGDRDVDAGHTQVDGEHAARAAVELQQGGWASTGAPPPAALLEEVGRDELVDPGTHGVPRGSGERDQVRPAPRAARPHMAQQRAGRGRCVRHAVIVTRAAKGPGRPRTTVAPSGDRGNG